MTKSPVDRYAPARDDAIGRMIVRRHVRASWALAAFLFFLAGGLWVMTRNLYGGQEPGASRLLFSSTLAVVTMILCGVNYAVTARKRITKRLKRDKNLEDRV